MTEKPANPLPLLILVLLFALPVVAGWVYFYNPQWLPASQVNKGRIIQPARSTLTLKANTPDGAAFDWSSLEKKWTLVTLAEGRCDPACLERLVKMRQIRRALGANRQRVERLLILLPGAEQDPQVPSLDGLEGTQLALVDQDDLTAYQHMFELDQADAGHSIFIFDPRAMLMMAHDTDTLTAKETLQDMEQLLKVSQNWVKGGQYGHK